MPPKRKAPKEKPQTEDPELAQPVKTKRARKPSVADTNEEVVRKRPTPKRQRLRKVTANEEPEPKKPSKSKKPVKPTKASSKKSPANVKSSTPGPSWKASPESTPEEKTKTKPRKIRAEPKPRKVAKKTGELIGKKDTPEIEKNDNEEVENGIEEELEAPSDTDETEVVENGGIGAEPEAKKSRAAKKTKESKAAREPKAPKGSKTADEPKATKELKAPKEKANKTLTDWTTLDFGCKAKNGYEVKHNLVISTWNVGGLKSWVSKGCLEFVKHENPDILCLQETKCSEEKIPEELKNLKPFNQYWCSSEKEGYAGVGLLSVKKPKKVIYGINNEDQDMDGRCITAEYDQFYLVNVYVPNAGRKLVTLPKRLEWNKAFKEFIITLDKSKPVIICGDMNVAHEEIDLARPSSNKRNAGFTAEEREGMTDFLTSGFIDVYRYFHPKEEGMYSFWTYMANARSKNIGWKSTESWRVLKNLRQTQQKEIISPIPMERWEIHYKHLLTENRRDFITTKEQNSRIEVTASPVESLI